MARGTWRRGTAAGGGPFVRPSTGNPAPHDDRTAGSDPVDIGVALTIYRRDADGVLVEIESRRGAAGRYTRDPLD